MTKHTLVLSEFGSDQGWRIDQHPRFVTDLTGDNKVDIVGFKEDGVHVALNNSNGTVTFGTPQNVLSFFGYNTGWRVLKNPRRLVDLTGDGQADIIGFGNDGVWVSRNQGNGTGTFLSPQKVLPYFGYNQGWKFNHYRFLADLTGNGRADIIGFGNDGVWISLNEYGVGRTFKTPKKVLPFFGFNTGWKDRHPRLLANLTGDRRADIVGFGNDGVWVSLNKGHGTFLPPQKVLPYFGYNQGWQVGKHPRFLADLTGDGRADIVGFGNDGVWISLNNGDGTFQEPQFVLSNFGYNQGWHVGKHPRFLADLTGDGCADIIGMGDYDGLVAINNSSGSFGQLIVVPDFYCIISRSWDADHPIFLIDLDGDKKADVLGFGDAGVFVSLNNGDGSFA